MNSNLATTYTAMRKRVYTLVLYCSAASACTCHSERTMHAFHEFYRALAVPLLSLTVLPSQLELPQLHSLLYQQ